MDKRLERGMLCGPSGILGALVAGFDRRRGTGSDQAVYQYCRNRCAVIMGSSIVCQVGDVVARGGSRSHPTHSA